MKRPILPALALISVALVAACSSSTGSVDPGLPGSAASASSSQTAEAGGVTVVAAWREPGVGATFDVKLDNHMIDLDAVDLRGAVLRNDRGELLTARPWAAPNGGHHREGALSFAGDIGAFLRGATWIQLTLPPIGSITEPPLRWSVNCSA